MLIAVSEMNCWQLLSLPTVLRSGIRTVATTRIGIWTWIWSTRHCGLGAGSDLLITMLDKVNWFHLTSLIALVLLMWKWMGLLLRKNRLLRCWDWLSLLNWISALTLSILLKLSPRKLEPRFIPWSFFHQRLLCIFLNPPYGHAWNTVVMSGLVLLVATWNCWISYKNICRIVGPSLAASLEPLAHCQNVVSLSFFYRYYFGIC